jgi:predicted outer membrane repeat protein
MVMSVWISNRSPPSQERLAISSDSVWDCFMSYFIRSSISAAVAFVLLLSAQGASIFTVTTLMDNVPGSLRRAILDSSSGDTIQFASNVRGTIVLTAGEISVPSPKNLTIIGPGYSRLTISGADTSRIFNIPGKLNVSGLRFVHGSGAGGAIFGDGDGLLADCVFEDNATGAGSVHGGALYLSTGDWEIDRCSFNRNRSDHAGGAIVVDAAVGDIKIDKCVFKENSASGAGGAIFITIPSTNTYYFSSTSTNFSLSESVFSFNSAAVGGAFLSYVDPSGSNKISACAFIGNQAMSTGGALRMASGFATDGRLIVDKCSFSSNAAEDGGAIYSNTPLFLIRSTVARNSSTARGGGVFSGIINGYSVDILIKNTVIALNNAQGEGPDIFGTFSSTGYNLVGNRDGGTGLGAIGDISGNTASEVNPKLGAPGLYGGSTYSIPLLPGSPAIDQGKTTNLATDQRGKPRQIDFQNIPNAASGDASDIGAFEVQLAHSYSTDFNLDTRPDLVLFSPSARSSAIWYLNNGQLVSTHYGPSLNLRPGYNIVGATDFNSDNKPDYLLYDSSTRKTEIWFLNNYAFTTNANGPTVTNGYTPLAVADVTGDGQGDLVLFNSTSRRTEFWYLYRGSYVDSDSGPSIPVGYNLVAVGDFNRDGQLDFLLANSSTNQTAIWYLRNGIKVGTAYGPNLVGGYFIAGVSDVNNDGDVDLILLNSSTHRIAYWYLHNNARVGTAYGPTLPAGYDLVAP